MVTIESTDLTTRLNYIIVGIEVAKTAIHEAEGEELEEIERVYAEALAEEHEETKAPKKKSKAKQKKVKR